MINVIPLTKTTLCFKINQIKKIHETEEIISSDLSPDQEEIYVKVSKINPEIHL